MRMMTFAVMPGRRLFAPSTDTVVAYSFTFAEYQLPGWGWLAMLSTFPSYSWSWMKTRAGIPGLTWSTRDSWMVTFTRMFERSGSRTSAWLSRIMAPSSTWPCDPLLPKRPPASLFA